MAECYLKVSQIQNDKVVLGVVETHLRYDHIGGHQVDLQVKNFLCLNDVHESYVNKSAQLSIDWHWLFYLPNKSSLGHKNHTV